MTVVLSGPTSDRRRSPTNGCVTWTDTRTVATLEVKPETATDDWTDEASGMASGVLTSKRFDVPGPKLLASVRGSVTGPAEEVTSSVKLTLAAHTNADVNRTLKGVRLSAEPAAGTFAKFAVACSMTTPGTFVCSVAATPVAVASPRLCSRT